MTLAASVAAVLSYQPTFLRRVCKESYLGVPPHDLGSGNGVLETAFTLGGDCFREISPEARMHEITPLPTAFGTEEGRPGSLK